MVKWKQMNKGLLQSFAKNRNEGYFWCTFNFAAVPLILRQNYDIFEWR